MRMISKLIVAGALEPDTDEVHRALIDALHHGDFFMVAADFDAYVTAPVKAFAAALAPRLEEALVTAV